MPQNIYDDPQFFEGYSQLRRSIEGLDGAAEWPAMQALLPKTEGQRLLDLGCGFGAFARWAAQNGAQSVLALDLSENMLARAKSLTSDSRIEYRRSNIEELDLPDGSFDLVYSSLALHYIEDVESVFHKVNQLLVPDGHFTFSVEHPIFTASRTQPDWQVGESGEKFWPVRDYLIEGKRVTDWIASGVVKYHHTISGYLNGLLEQGFQLLHLDEWKPSEKQLAEMPDWEIELQRPMFLLISARKAS